MQFDTNSADASAEKLQMLDTFLKLIPDIVIGTSQTYESVNVK
jgi:hypothetical protein